MRFSAMYLSQFNTKNKPMLAKAYLGIFVHIMGKQQNCSHSLSLLMHAFTVAGVDKVKQREFLSPVSVRSFYWEQM